MIQLAIVLGSTRPGRVGETVARWVAEVAGRHPAVAAREVGLEVVDLADYELPLLDEPAPAATGLYLHPHTKRWAATIGRFDGYVFVTPEYNGSMPAALKNAIDYLYAEWNDKAAGFVSYGLHGGIRAVEQLRQTMGELRVADVQARVALNLSTDFDSGSCAPDDHHETVLTTLLDQVLAWSHALRPLRDSTGGPIG